MCCQIRAGLLALALPRCQCTCRAERWQKSIICTNRGDRLNLWLCGINFSCVEGFGLVFFLLSPCYGYGLLEKQGSFFKS